MLYLSPFSDEQVEVYLRKRFPNRWWDWCRKLFSKQDNRRLEEARWLLKPMRSLRMRPMLLAYIDVLMGAGLEVLTEYSVYAALVAQWLLREERKTPGGPTREVLWEACSAVAMHLQRTGQRVLTAEGLREVLVEHPDAIYLQSIDVGGRSLLNLTSDRNYRFAHYSIQEFLVARRLVTDAWEQVGKPPRATDQLLRFLSSWARDAGFQVALHKGADLAGATFEKHGVELVWIPGGEFWLGEGESKHRVRLSPFLMGKFPVTNAQYRRFLEANPGQEKPKYWQNKEYNEPEQPAVGVSWHEAMAFCRWAGLGLPSEAQWEAAARGSEARAYPWGDTEPTHEFANYERKVGRPTPVGSYPKGAGPFGTLDQAGNVWEWCRIVDKNLDSDYVVGDFVDKTVDNSAIRVVRGGSWSSPAGDLRSAIRSWPGAMVEDLDFSLGFRCAGAIPSEP